MKKVLFLGVFIAVVYLGYRHYDGNIKLALADAKKKISWLRQTVKPLVSENHSSSVSEAAPTPQESEVHFPSTSELRTNNAEPKSHRDDLSSSSHSGSYATTSHTTTHSTTDIPSSTSREIREMSSSEVSYPERTIDKLDWIKEKTAQYSPDSWYLLQQYDALPIELSAKSIDNGTIRSTKNTPVYHYVKTGTDAQIIQSMSTNIHEIAHSFLSMNKYPYANHHNIRLNWDCAEGYFYLSPDEHYFVSVPKSILFPSKKLSHVIPEKQRTFRYDTYIEGNTSTQGQGVFGLLNELHAYYLGARYAYEMKDVYIQQYDSEAMGVSRWITESQSELSAFYEFSYFIMEYLLFMKQSATENYQLLIANKSFTTTYKSIYRHYKKLIEDYNSVVMTHVNNINKSEVYKAWVEDRVLWIQQKDNRSSIGAHIYSESVDILNPVLLGNRYDSIKTDLHW